MSNYNLTLQSNNTDLQAILNTINELPNAGGSDPVLQDKTVTPTTSSQSIKADSGYDGLSTVTVNAMPTATQATPSITINASGLITATATQTAGYVAAGSKSATKQLVFQAAKTITPSTASQIAVSSGYYTGGDITVKGDENLKADNIISGKSIFGVIGTATAGGGNNEDLLITRAITNYTNNRVTTIGSNAFANCSKLTSVSFPAATTIGSNAFANCSKLTSVSFPSAKTIGSSAFYGCSNLTTISFPVAKTIGSSAFYGCSNLTTISFPVATSIGSSAFRGCSSLTTISFPVARTIGSGAFMQCYNLTSVNFPVATSMGSSAFMHCSNLTTVSFPKVTIVNYGAFERCTRLTSVNFPVATSIDSSAFYSCSSLTTVSFPAVRSIGSYAFYDCSKLTSASFPAATTIGYGAFSRCYNLISLYLLGFSMCKLSASNAFTFTPIGGYSKSAGQYGSIYVPTSLLTSYKAATNWTYFSSRFVGI